MRPVDRQRLEAPRDHRPRFDGGARRTHRQPAAVLDAAFRGQLGAEFHEHFRLQFVEPAVEAAHRAAQVMLGQAKRAANDGIFARRRRARSD